MPRRARGIVWWRRGTAGEPGVVVAKEGEDLHPAGGVVVLEPGTRDEVDLLGRVGHVPGRGAAAVGLLPVHGAPALADDVPRGLESAHRELAGDQVGRRGGNPHARTRQHHATLVDDARRGREGPLVLLSLGRQGVVDDTPVGQHHRQLGALLRLQPPAFDRNRCRQVGVAAVDPDTADGQGIVVGEQSPARRDDGRRETGMEHEAEPVDADVPVLTPA
jgi:hypothetical protein